MSFITKLHEKNKTKITHSRYNFCLSLFPPFCNLGIDLLSDLRLDLSGVSREESQEALGSAVDDIDLMQRDGMHHFLPFLELSLWTLNELGLMKKQHAPKCL